MHRHLPSLNLFRFAALALMALAAGAAPGRAQADTGVAAAVACPGDAALVEGATADDLRDVCAGATAAHRFFAAHAAQATAPVFFVVTTRLPPEAGATAAGCYMEQKRRVYVVPYAAFRRYKTWFGVPITRQVYRSLAAHEMAHALAACSFQIPHPTIQAKEYLAYVTMFSVMPPALRQQVLQSMRTEGFGTLDRFTPLLYMFDPMRFGAEAYRHFSGVAQPQAVFDDVLTGRALTD